MNPLMRDCSPENVRNAAPDLYGAVWKPVHPGSIMESVNGYMSQRQYALAMRRVTAVFDSLVSANQPRPTPATYDQDTAIIRSQFYAAMDELSGNKALNATRFNVATRITRGVPTITLISASLTGSDTIVFNDAPADSAFHRSVCWPALAADFILSAASQGSRRAIASRLDTLDADWTTYRSRSYSQYPWELLINGLRPNRSLAPPSHQIVLLHPSVAVEVSNIGSGFSTRDIYRRDVMAVEWLGFVRRWGRDWSRSFGLSAVSSFSRSPGTDVGVMLHWGSLIELGVTRQPLVDGRRPYGALLTADFYRMLDPLRGKLGLP